MCLRDSHSTVSRLGITPWLEYVGTEDNIADLPSRGEFGLLYTLGGPISFRPAVLLLGSSFTGLLEPLGGFGLGQPSTTRSLTES